MAPFDESLTLFISSSSVVSCSQESKCCWAIFVCFGKTIEFEFKEEEEDEDEKDVESDWVLINSLKNKTNESI